MERAVTEEIWHIIPIILIPIRKTSIQIPFIECITNWYISIYQNGDIKKQTGIGKTGILSHSNTPKKTENQ